MRPSTILAALCLTSCAAAPPPPPDPAPAPTTPACPETKAPAGPLRFRVTLPKDAKPIGGHVIVFMSNNPERQQQLGPGFGTPDPAMAAADVERLEPGGSFEIDPDRIAYPKPFSQLPAGNYQVMALLDPDGSFPVMGHDAGDLCSAVEQVTVDPAHATPITLELNRTTPPRVYQAEPGVETVNLPSKLLSAFHGRPIHLEAFVMLPQAMDAKKRYPALYLIPGYGSNDDKRRERARIMHQAMTAPPWSEVIFVYLKGASPGGHHVFADSANNGPWGRALVEELIPYLEKRYPMMGKPEGRLLTGHSSGGWASLWLQLNHPDFFGGTWSTSPDPVDFRAFFGASVAPGSAENIYRTREGKPRNVWRDGDREVMSFEELTRLEAVEGAYGGIYSTMEWAFSPRGPNGRPMPLFDRRTGAIDPEVQQAWTRYDIHTVLASRWKELGPKLAGKLHLAAGAQDNFHLEASLKLLCDFLKEQGSDATCTFVPGKDHFNLYGTSLTGPVLEGMVKEMLAASKRTGKKR